MPTIAYIAVVLFLLAFFPSKYLSYINILDWKLLLEYIRVIIWPSITLFFLLNYRKEIKEFINKIHKVKTPWGEASTETVAAQISSESALYLNHISDTPRAPFHFARGLFSSTSTA